MFASIKTTRAAHSRLSSIDWNHLPFGKIFTDHMLVMDYADGAWQTPEIIPFGPLSLSPSNTTLHYGQSIFEGLKAVRADNDRISLFRPELNAKRFNESCQRMCMPAIDEHYFVDLIKHFVHFEQAWIPPQHDASLYIRPFMFATDEQLAARPSERFKFIILTCPVGAYYAEPVHVKIEQQFTRAAQGGVGRAKTAGNYAASFYPTKLANAQGFHQLIWTDSQTHQFIEESGTMNLMLVIDGVLITPSEDSDTILRGVVKRSVVDLAKHWGMPVEERQISVDELVQAIRDQRLEDAFGAGTAATIAPIAKIGYGDEVFELPTIATRTVSKKIKAYLEGIRSGTCADELAWCVEV
jgi:branched-chain amino acid aminotransferase